jgi:hypothetical protein
MRRYRTDTSLHTLGNVLPLRWQSGDFSVTSHGIIKLKEVINREDEYKLKTEENTQICMIYIPKKLQEFVFQYEIQLYHIHSDLVEHKNISS